MFLKSSLMAMAGASMLLLAATPMLAAGHVQGAANICANAAAIAQAKGTATDSDIAQCTVAIRLAYYEPQRAAALANRSALYVVSGRYEAAVADSNAALQLDDQLTEAYVNRGAAFLLQHRSTDAGADFTRALALAPAHREIVYFNRAIAREDMGDLQGAYADYRAASDLKPSWDRPKQELVRFTVAPAKPIS
jgi:tetratricopeptide (TPR) repeat protein